MKLRRFILIFGILAFVEAHAELPEWQIDYASSKVSFVAKQAGAEFEGHWDEWDAEVRFDPSDLANSSAVARFHASSVQTSDLERDQTLQDGEWFDGAAHPLIIYEAIAFSPSADGGFEAASTLTVKGISVPVIFRFRVSEDAGIRALKGEAEIDRLAAGLGLGEWADTKWIGQFVRVHVVLHARDLGS